MMTRFIRRGTALAALTLCLGVASGCAPEAKPVTTDEAARQTALTAQGVGKTAATTTARGQQNNATPTTTTTTTGGAR